MVNGKKETQNKENGENKKQNLVGKKETGKSNGKRNIY